MAQRKIKIALSSTLENIFPMIDVYLDGTKIANDVQITGNTATPTILEYEFTSAINHELKLIMKNDYYVDGEVDLNCTVQYIQLSDESFVYPNYTYLVSDSSMNLRTADNSSLFTETLWGENGQYVLTFNIDSPITFYDIYQYNLDNP